jgi:hypothetical protein
MSLARRRAMRLSSLLFLLLVACNAKVDSPENTDANESPQRAASGTAADARCDAARGAADPIVAKTDVPPRLAGRWYLCPGFGKSEQQPLSAEDAIEFSADGKWWWLARGEDGTWTRKPGVENAGTWDQEWADSSQPNMIYVREWNNAFYWLTLGFETDPRRILGTYYSDNPVHMVPLD